MAEKNSRLSQWLEGLSRRERWLLLAVAFVASFGLGFQLVVTPLDNQAERLAQQLSVETTRMEQLRADLVGATEQVASQGDLEVRLRELENEIETLESSLDALSAQFAGAARTAGLLRTMLEDTNGLALIRMDRKPHEVAFEAETPRGERIRLLRHPIVLEVRGSYPDVLAYLESLEALPLLWAWERFELQPAAYPEHRVRIVVTAFSLEERIDA